MSKACPTGTIYLIGAGPGDAGLLTLRGAELLRRCDVVLYDGLCNPELLHHAPQAEQICVGKHGQSRIWTQDEINQKMVSLSQNGKMVARLKGGDPAIFARTAEEIDALQQANVPFQIVPGITAALAAGSFAGIPITHRAIASAVALVTGHEEPEKQESAIDWSALAKFPGTLVVYMGVTTAPQWTKRLLDAGKPASTNVAIVRRCSLPDQRVIRCKLSEVVECLASQVVRPPAIFIIGEVATLSDAMNWIDRRPLMGKKVLVTRPIEQAPALATLLRERGAQVLQQPAIAIGEPDDVLLLQRAIRELPSYDFIVFCSHNGVRYFFSQLWNDGFDQRHFAETQIAVVGSKTSEALEQYHLRADIVPSNFRAEDLIDELKNRVNGKRVLIVRASRGRELIAAELRKAGGDVQEVVAYSHRDVSDCHPSIRSLVDSSSIDWITVTSSATAKSVAKMFGPKLATMKIASLSPVTSETIRELGFKVAAEANPYTIESLVDAIAHAELGEQS